MDPTYDGAHFSGDQAGAGAGNAARGGGLRGVNHEGQRGQVAVGGEVAGRCEGAHPAPLPFGRGPSDTGSAWNEAELYVGPQGHATEHDTQRGGGGNARHSWVDYRGPQRVIETGCFKTVWLVGSEDVPLVASWWIKANYERHLITIDKKQGENKGKGGRKGGKGGEPEPLMKKGGFHL